MHIRDPIHGAIEISAEERALVDAPVYQRLRNIKQLGFAELAFPGATHTRYSHGIGAMAVASRVFDTLFGARRPLPSADAERFRQALRIAVLFHDLGHPPLSHTSEMALPPVGEVKLPAWLADGDPLRRATHEDMTLKLVADSPLTQLIEQLFGARGIRAADVAALISGRDAPGGSPFASAGVDYTPLLRQIVSSELDADRMDYLFRDSFFSGVNYGKFDLDWLVQNLDFTVREGRAWLALDRRAIFAFEDFLLSRYHMFLSVYFHRTSVAYEQMLHRFYRDSPDEYRLPADPEAYLECDDVQLIAAMRRSASPWARRIVRRQGYRAVYEVHPGEPDHSDAVRAALAEARIDVLSGESTGALSKYLGTPRGIFVKTRAGDVPIEEYTPLFRRYAEAARLVRVYAAPEDEERARAAVARALEAPTAAAGTR